MIVKAAVKIFDKKQNKEWCIPCMRHCDAFYILKEFGYTKQDYKEIAQGFLDEHGQFYLRIDAYRHAIECGQISEDSCEYKCLFSEDLW